MVNANLMLAVCGGVHLLMSVILTGLLAAGRITMLSMRYHEVAGLTFYGFLIIHAVIMITYIPKLKAPMPAYLRMIFSIVGLGMFVAVGALAIKDGRQLTASINIPLLLDIDLKSDNYHSTLAAGAISIINGLLYIPDIFFCIKASKSKN